MTSHTAQLAAFASALSFEDIPDPVVRKIEDLLVDWFGSTVAPPAQLARLEQMTACICLSSDPGLAPSHGKPAAARHLLING